MKIDLHVHTKKCKKGDSEKRNVSVELFRRKILLAGVSVVGITNHNHFDLEQYMLLKDAVKDVCDVWPGVEFDARQSDTKIGHVIVVVNPKHASSFSAEVNRIVGAASCDDFIISIDDLVSYFNDFDPVFIPHYYKPKSLGEQDMELLEKTVYHKSRLIKEPSNIASVGVLNSYHQKCLLGSDVQDWDNYENGTFSELKYDFDGYENFLKLLDKDVAYINSLLDGSFKGEVQVYGDSEERKYPFKIKYYNDVNIIFGDRGSGKTEILKSLKSYFDERSIKALYYKGGDKSEWFRGQLAIDISDYSYSDMGLSDDCSNSFNLIKDYQDPLPVQLGEFSTYFDNVAKNAKASKIKIPSFSKTNDSSLPRVLNDWSDYFKIKTFITEIQSMNVYKSNPTKYQELMNQLKRILADAFQLYRSSFISYYSNRLFDFSIEKINTSISECKGQPRLPTKTGFFDFANARIELYIALNNIKNALLTQPVLKNRSFIGEIGIKGEGYIEETIRFINKDNINSISARLQNGRKTKYESFFKQFEQVYKSKFSSDLAPNIVQLKRILGECTINDINFFLCPIKLFKIGDVSYTPSKGEECILSMQYELISQKDEYSIFIIDEPESGLGNDYIEKNIVPLIKDMARSRKTVFVATHNANIAVRTLPATSILKLVDNELYTTYQGSMFTNILANIDNNQDTKSWNVVSEIHLEGGEKAFTERGFYYAGNN